jgi:copper homeostasis protein
MVLEIAVFDLASAFIAENAGADRIELCHDYSSGGVTVSNEVLVSVKESITIPVFPIIRPRGGNFVYTDEEFEQIITSVRLCKSLGYTGIVTGILNSDHTVNTKQTSALVELAYPMEVTFHRAFDETAVPEEALEDIINCGCKRILTSGCKNTAAEGIDLLKKLVIQANGRISIMPGGGIRPGNLHSLLTTNASEFHSAALKRENNQLSINIKDIQAMKTILS